MYEVLIIEDSDTEAEALVNHLARYDSDRQVGLHVTRRVSAVDLFNDDEHYDLIFMDIDLPGENGMDAARRLRERDTDTPLIFVTNLARFAIKGYQVDALDFIVKPITYYNFAMRMDRAVRAMHRNERATLAINTTEGISVVDIADIVYVEVRAHYLYYHVVGEEPLRSRGTITEAEKELAGHSFVRVSKGHLVNMGHITRMGAEELVVTGGEVLYFSRPRKREAQATITNYMTGGI